MSKSEAVEIRGKVVKALPNTWFLVEVAGGHQIRATIGGKLRKNNIRIIVGDEVQIECSPYSLSVGRIVYRF